MKGEITSPSESLDSSTIISVAGGREGGREEGREGGIVNSFWQESEHTAELWKRTHSHTLSRNAITCSRTIAHSQGSGRGSIRPLYARLYAMFTHEKY